MMIASKAFLFSIALIFLYIILHLLLDQIRINIEIKKEQKIIEANRIKEVERRNRERLKL